MKIQGQETDRLARELAAMTGESITLAVRRALEERLSDSEQGREVDVLTDELRLLILRGRARADLDRGGPEETPHYDEHGLPS